MDGLNIGPKIICIFAALKSQYDYKGFL